MTVGTTTPTYQELMAERYELVKDIHRWDKEMTNLRRLSLNRNEFFERKDRIVNALTDSRTRIIEIKALLVELYPHGQRADSGKAFWKARSDALVDSLDVVLDDETASPSVKATIEAALRTHRRSMTPKGGDEAIPVDTFLEERDVG